MAITRDINAFSPDSPAPLTVQTLAVQIGGVSGARPVTEAFEYDAATMGPGILLSYPVATGTVPAVYLRGLRMTVQQAAEDADVAVVEALDELGDPSNAVAFIGSTYSVAAGDRVLIDYWTAE